MPNFPLEKNFRDARGLAPFPTKTIKAKFLPENALCIVFIPPCVPLNTIGWSMSTEITAWQPATMMLSSWTFIDINTTFDTINQIDLKFRTSWTFANETMIGCYWSLVDTNHIQATNFIYSRSNRHNFITVDCTQWEIIWCASIRKENSFVRWLRLVFP